MSGHSQFQDRRDAGRRLAARLGHLASERPLVLALPRGGVPVAFEVAKVLDAELDVLIVRKLGAPGHEELGLGAVIDGSSPQVFLNDFVVREFGASDAYIAAETRRQLAEIERRRQSYRSDAPPPAIAGRCVIVVDDGIATGAPSQRRCVRCTRPNRGGWCSPYPWPPPTRSPPSRRNATSLSACINPSPFTRWAHTMPNSTRPATPR